MKIAVYTIAKDEEANVSDWAANTQSADYRIFCDTGSSDRTIARAIDASLSPIEIRILPWRFDDAHNAALSHVPEDADICIPLHMDERLCDRWRVLLEKHWRAHTTKCFYTYVFSPELSFLQNRIHARKGYRWVYPDHEGVYPYGETPESSVSIPELVITQTQDRQKDRSGILARLEIGVKEYPHSARMAHYLGRELMYRARYAEAIVELQRYWSLEGQWPEEQAQNAECLTLCYRNLGRVQ